MLGAKHINAWPWFVAQRYLFSKKTHNVINVITLVSMCGVAVGTMALLCVLSVLNGFENMVTNSFTAFDPDLRITACEGRTFDVAAPAFAQVRAMDDVAVFAEVCASNALLACNDRQIPVQVCGVSPNYAELNDIRQLVVDGKFSIDERAMAGIGLVNALNAAYDAPLTLYVPKRLANVNLARPDNAFRRHELFLAGVFATGQQQYDDATLIVPLALAQNLFDYEHNEVSSVELKLAPKTNVDKVQSAIACCLGEGFVVQNRYEQQADFYRILQIEKWITFLILTFIVLIATCNIIGSLSMLMINKRADIELFYALGARNSKIRWLFWCEGWMITVYGTVVGIVVGIVLCLLQQHVGIIKMGAGYMIENYPVALRWSDVVLVFVTVLALGFALAAYPVSVLRQRRLSNG
ncbi:MAG: ABC transporter permease [Paludibacteraceae bacterium]